MPSRVLLISVNRCDSPYPVFPLGLGYLDSALQQRGHQTRWLDCQLDRLDILEAIADFPPDCVGISVRNIDDVLIKKRETFFNGLAPLCREIRRHTNSPIVLDRKS